MTQPKENKYVSIPELAKILGISRIAVFRRVKSGQIKAEKIGKNYAIARRAVQGFLGQVLDKEAKHKIDLALQRTMHDYGQTLKLLGRD